MEKGWKAKGRLEPLYEQVGGRDKLAELSGLSVGHVSSVNGGTKDLGIAAANKLLAATSGFSLLDLGAPARVVSGQRREAAAVTRLAQLEKKHAELRRQFDAFVEATTARLALREEDPGKRAQG